MNKRLSFEQKYELVYGLLVRAGRSMSAFEIGRELDYSSGKAVRKVLDWMVDTERAKAERRKHRLGSALYYRINPEFANHRQDNTFVSHD